MDQNINTRYRFTIALIQSAFFETGKNLDEVIKICLNSGFSGLEGWLPFFEDKTEKELMGIEEKFKKAGLQIETFHLPHKNTAFNDIAALYETDRRRVEDIMKRWIDTAATLGSTIGILHPTTLKGYQVEIEGPERLLSQLGKTLENLLRYSEQYNFHIALENMLPSLGDRLGSSISHFEEILHRHDHPNLGFCLDTGHAHVSHGADAMEMFHFMKDRLIAFHLNDNAGDRDSHLAPGHGRFPWKDFFMELERINFKHTICVEAPPFDFGPDYSLDAWKNFHLELHELSTMAGKDTREKNQ